MLKNTRFYNWLKFHRPTSATLKDWRTFRKTFKTKAPVRYFLMEQLPSYFRTRVRRPLHHFVWWFKYRIIPRHRYHVVKTGLKPGYHEIEDIMTHSIFTLLCDFVEIELACWDDKISKKYRSRARGEQYMRNFITEFENDKMEAEHVAYYKDLLELYVWWKDVYPTFKAYEHRGANPVRVYSNKDGFLLDFFSTEDAPTIVVRQSTDWMAKYDAQQRAFDDETDRMVMQAVKIRRLMWS